MKDFHIENSILYISHNQNFYNSKLHILNICEQILESLIFIEIVYDIINSNSSARLESVHPSVIQSEDFINQLWLISRNLPINTIKPKCKYIIFILPITLIQPEESLFHIYSVPKFPNPGTKFSHKYIAIRRDNTLY